MRVETRVRSVSDQVPWGPDACGMKGIRVPAGLPVSRHSVDGSHAFVYNGSVLVDYDHYQMTEAVRPNSSGSSLVIFGIVNAVGICLIAIGVAAKRF